MIEPCEIWLTENLFCVVDPEDYAWAKQWKWHYVRNSTGKKHYATRNTKRGGRGGTNVKIYLHKEILERSGKKAPTPKHTIGDHQDGDSLNCRRANLEWATPSINRQNTGGYHAAQAAMRL